MNHLLAAAVGADAPPALLQFLPLVGMGLIFWFLIIRPQMRQQKAHQQKVDGLSRGDQVVTAGGLVGKITKVKDDYVHIELAKGMVVKAVRNTIGDVVPPAGAKPVNDVHGPLSRGDPPTCSTFRPGRKPGSG